MYTVEITAEGFNTLSLGAVTVSAGCSNFRSISLSIGEPSTRIEVLDDGPLIDTRQCAVAENTFAAVNVAICDRIIVETNPPHHNWMVRTFAKIKRSLSGKHAPSGCN